MANTVLKEKSFNERGYIYNKPTRLECIEMGWHYRHCSYDILAEFHKVQGAASWIKSTMWWQDFVLFPQGEVYFKHERDLLMFKLKWS